MEKELMESLIRQFHEYLDQLSQEIGSFKEEDRMWILEGEISNSAGNLCLHIIGNLNHFIGHLLGGSGYIRNRPSEFADKNVGVHIMLGRIDETKKMISDVLSNFDTGKLNEKFPLENWNESNMHFIIHLLKHLAYHLGQINYHRRLLDIRTK